MKVIFLKDVPGVAQHSDVKEMSEGYARNFLFPKQLAKLATPAALAERARHQAGRAETKEKEEETFKKIIEKLRATPLRFKMKIGEKGIAFGSVSEAKIAEALKKMGVEIDKDCIEMDDHIKTTGTHLVKIKFPHEIVGEVQVIVEAE